MELSSVLPPTPTGSSINSRNGVSSDLQTKKHFFVLSSEDIPASKHESAFSSNPDDLLHVNEPVIGSPSGAYLINAQSYPTQRSNDLLINETSVTSLAPKLRTPERDFHHPRRRHNMKPVKGNNRFGRRGRPRCGVCRRWRLKVLMSKGVI